MFPGSFTCYYGNLNFNSAWACLFSTGLMYPIMRIEWRESKTVVGYYWYCRHFYCKYQQKGLLSRNWLTKSFSWVHLCLLCHSFGLRQHMILRAAHICTEHRVQIFKGTSSTWGCSSGKSCTWYYLKLEVLEWRGYTYTPIFTSTSCTLLVHLLYTCE